MNRFQPILQHGCIWEYQIHVLKWQVDKLESTTRGIYFYSQGKKIFVSTNARFLEEDYMIGYNKPSDTKYNCVATNYT